MTNPDTPTKAVEAPPHFCQAWGSCDYCAICGQAMPVPTGPVATPSPADRAASVGAVERHQPTNREDAEAGNVAAIRHVAYGEGYRDGKAAALATPQALPTPQFNNNQGNSDDN